VNPVTIVTLSGLAILTVWGLIAPRAEWRVLMSWSRRDPDAGDPTPAVRNLVRLVSAIGVVIVAWTSFATFNPETPQSIPSAYSGQSRAELTWGSPEPKIIDRVFTPLAEPPAGLVDQPILRYLPISGSTRSPSYIFAFKDFAAIGATSRDGYIGTKPDLGLSALDTADLVVQVRGDKKCIPVAVLVKQAEHAVSVGVFYGRPNPPGGTAVVANCKPVVANGASNSVLIPIDLTAPLGLRTVVRVDGTSIAKAAG
jgi:hypothetical protein